MKVLGIIPARFASSRLPGKPLMEIAGKTMIQRVYERAKNVLENVVVATDSNEILHHVKKFGGEVILTSPQHQTGTNRCLEAFENLNREFDVILNIQGDEPLLHPDHIRLTLNCFEDPLVQMASLVIAAPENAILKSGEGVYVVMDKNRDALYFSRSVIPFVRNYPSAEWSAQHTFYKHIGMYGFRPNALQKFASLSESSLESAESLEQNRWLQNGYKIRLGITSKEVIAVDTPEDLEAVRKIFQSKEGESE